MWAQFPASWVQTSIYRLGSQCPGLGVICGGHELSESQYLGEPEKKSEAGYYKCSQEQGLNTKRGFPVISFYKYVYFARILFSELERQGKSEQRQYFTLGWQAAVRGIYGLVAVRRRPVRVCGGTGSCGEATKNSEFRFKSNFGALFRK